MHLNLDIEYKDLITIVKQLPISELKRLNITINKEISLKKQSTITDMQSLILKAPTWSENEYNEYLFAKEYVNKSRLA